MNRQHTNSEDTITISVNLKKITASSPAPVGSVLAAYSPRCDVHRGVRTQMQSAFLTAPDSEKRRELYNFLKLNDSEKKN